MGQQQQQHRQLLQKLAVVTLKERRKKSAVKKRWVGKIEFQVFEFRSRKVSVFFRLCGRCNVRPRNGRRFESRVRRFSFPFRLVFLFFRWESWVELKTGKYLDKDSCHCSTLMSVIFASRATVSSAEGKKFRGRIIIIFLVVLESFSFKKVLEKMNFSFV